MAADEMCPESSEAPGGEEVGDRAAAGGRPPAPLVPTGPEVEAGTPLDSPRPPVAVTSPWLARLPGETTSEQMSRIRRTCRWCGDEFRAIDRIELARHERAHAAAEMETDELPGIS